MKKLTKPDWAYLAGLIDGDGCFTISMTRSRKSNGDFKNGICFTPQITINLKASDGKYLDALQTKFNVGKVYWHKMLTENAKQSWNIFRLADSIWITENLIPFLCIKHDKAIRFLEVCKYWQSLIVSTPLKVKGYRHTQKQMLHMAGIACNLNYDRQTVRYRNKKGMDYWQPLIEAWYPD